MVYVVAIGFLALVVAVIFATFKAEKRSKYEINDEWRKLP